MPNPAAIAVVTAAISLTRTHGHAPPLDILDIVMQGLGGQTLDFADSGARHCSLVDPAESFGQLVAAGLDKGMYPEEWVAFTSDRADPRLRDACMGVWRDEVLPKLAARFAVTVRGGPGGP